jgi:cell division protein FtsB
MIRILDKQSGSPAFPVLPSCDRSPALVPPSQAEHNTALVFFADSRYKHREALYHTILESALKRKGALLAAVILAVCVWIGVRLPQGLSDLQEKRALIRQLTEVNAAMKLENDRRRERIRRLETSPSEQEMEIRKQLKLVKPGETTFILPNAPAAAPESKPPTQP